jgi:hypothetical protein
MSPIGVAHINADIIPHCRTLTDLRQLGNHPLGTEH